MGVLIQIGANSGLDHVSKFIEDKDFDLILLVEPIPFIIDKLRDNYSQVKNVKIENVAVLPENQSFTTFFYDGSPCANYEVSTVFKEHLVHHGCDSQYLKSMTVPAIGINELFKKYALTTIDHLFIDAEGLDCDLVCAIDFDYITIRNIVMESRHTDGAFKRGANLQKTIKFLESKNYNITDNQIDLKAVLVC